MSLKLIVGLGNPGANYEMTRHNAGFALLDRLVTKYGGTFAHNNKMQAELCKLKLDAFNLILAKPMTYMNLSGQAVSAIMAFYKIEKTQLLVAHDEVALPLGVLRLAKGGGSAGNHGIESIMSHLGHKDFNRLRLGVGPDPGGARRADYVLSRFPAHEEELFFKAIDLAAEASEIWLRRGIQEAMNKYNGMDLRPLEAENAPQK